MVWCWISIQCYTRKENKYIDNGHLPSGKAQEFDSCNRWFESNMPSYANLTQLVRVTAL